MSAPKHVYRLSDFMEQVYQKARPILLFPCRDTCLRENGCRQCLHEHLFEPLTDLPLSVFAVHAEDLHQIPLRGYEASWGHALLLYGGQVVHQWPHVPTRSELQTALDTLNASLQRP